MLFTESHEWISVDGEIGTVGVTAHAQKELGEVVYVELPPVGKHLLTAHEAAVLESTKAASDVYAPVAGEVVAINEKLKNSCEFINRSPEADGWLFKIKISSLEELHTLMEREEYLNITQ
jgi:glycine cleavage system H protein